MIYNKNKEIKSKRKGRLEIVPITVQVQINHANRIATNLLVSLPLYMPYKICICERSVL